MSYHIVLPDNRFVGRWALRPEAPSWVADHSQYTPDTRARTLVVADTRIVADIRVVADTLVVADTRDASVCLTLDAVTRNHPYSIPPYCKFKTQRAAV